MSINWRVIAAIAAICGLVGCTSEPTAESSTVMPDVIGTSLDVALSDIERAGVEDEVEVLGGGTFGILDESNWQVCEQVPDAGQDVTDPPRLSVDRSCDEEESDSASESDEQASSDTTPPTEPEPVTTDAPVEEPEPVATDAPVGEPEPVATDAPIEEPEPVDTSAPTVEVLTAENNEDLAALLTGPGECDDSVSAFASSYRGRTIEFDGNVAFVANHDDYDTRFDFLIYVGDFSDTVAAPGPSFQFEDENFTDLKMTGSNIPDAIGPGLNIRVVAEVEEFTEGCRLLLDPVSTEVR